MKELNDKELDDLIMQTLEREDVLRDVESQVMKTVKVQSLRAKVRRWVRLLAFFFGLPVFMVLMLASAYYLIKLSDNSPSVIGSMLVFTVTIIHLCYQNLQKFSIE